VDLQSVGKQRYAKATTCMALDQAKINRFLPTDQSPVVLTKSLKISLLHGALDWRKIIKSVLEKTLFFTLGYFSFFCFSFEKFRKLPLEG
jgi:hypothetical protein